MRDMVESHEIEVPFVRTHDNISDFLTKPMANAAAFFYMRAVVMNEKRAASGCDALAGGARVAERGGPHPTRGGVRAREARTHAAWHETRGFAPAGLVRPGRL